MIIAVTMIETFNTETMQKEYHIQVEYLMAEHMIMIGHVFYDEDTATRVGNHYKEIALIIDENDNTDGKLN